MKGDAATIRNPLTCGFCGQYNTCDSTMRKGSTKSILVCQSNCPDAPREGALQPGDVGISVGHIKKSGNKGRCTNLPLQCELCPSRKYVWKYHMPTHVAEAHGGDNGVDGGGTPGFRASLDISDEERKGVKDDLEVRRRTGNESGNKRSNSAQEEAGGRSRARTSSGGAGSSSSAQERTRRSSRARVPRSVAGRGRESLVAGAMAAFVEDGGSEDVRV